MPTRWYGAIVLVAALHAQAQPAQGQTPCIDVRPSSPAINSMSLSFKAADGRVVSRSNLVLKDIDAGKGTIVVDDNGSRVELDMREWNRIEVAVDDRIPMMVQRPMPLKTPLLAVAHEKHALASVRVADGMIRFPACADQAASGGPEIRFKGVLSFDARQGTLDIDGSYTRYEMPASTGGNPGASKR